MDKPQWTPALKAQVLRKIRPDARQMLAYMGKPQTYWDLQNDRHFIRFRDLPLLYGRVPKVANSSIKAALCRLLSTPPQEGVVDNLRWVLENRNPG